MIEDDGNVLLARQLDWETRKEYNLTVAVTDGVHTTVTQLLVSVKDINEYRPVFSQDLYEVNVTENAEIGSPVVQLRATDDDQDVRLLYGIHSAQHVNSVRSFAVDYQTGVVSVQQPLDRCVPDVYDIRIVSCPDRECRLSRSLGVPTRGLVARNESAARGVLTAASATFVRLVRSERPSVTDRGGGIYIDGGIYSGRCRCIIIVG